MMPVRGLSSEEICLPKTRLYAKHGVYFPAIMMCMWDNIHGPKVLNVWTADEPAMPPHRAKLAELSARDRGVVAVEVDPEKLTKEIKQQLAESLTLSEVSCSISDATLLSVANYTLNDEAGRVERMEGIETKLYSLKKYNVIATSFVFATEVVRGKTEVFSFVLVLPYSEMSNYLARHSLCETRVQRMLQNSFITPLQEMSQHGRQLREKLEKVLEGFSDPLLKFTQTMRKLNQYPLPEKISVSDTFLGKDLPTKCFLSQAISCHLQTSGYTVVLGSNRDTVNKTILTLALFLSPKERKMSRLVCSDLGKVESDVYEPDVFLQGFVVVPDPASFLPFTKRDLYCNKLPPNIINCDTGEIRLIEPKIPLFIRQREDIETESKQNPKLAFGSETIPADLSSFKPVEKEWQSQLVSNFIEQTKLLPLFPGVRESFVFQYLRLLKLKSLAMAKYIDAEPKTSFQEMAMEVLALGRGPGTERPKVNKLALMQNLSIDSYGDLLVVLAFAEKIRPRTYMDVLGDPHLNDLAMIKEFETF